MYYNINNLYIEDIQYYYIYTLQAGLTQAQKHCKDLPATSTTVYVVHLGAMAPGYLSLSSSFIIVGGVCAAT